MRQQTVCLLTSGVVSLGLVQQIHDLGAGVSSDHILDMSGLLQELSLGLVGGIGHSDAIIVDAGLQIDLGGLTVQTLLLLAVSGSGLGQDLLDILTKSTSRPIASAQPLNVALSIISIMFPIVVSTLSSISLSGLSMHSINMAGVIYVCRIVV